LVMEIGEAAEKGMSVFSQSNTGAVNAFEKISELIISDSKVK
jgi:hypothetical protein